MTEKRKPRIMICDDEPAARHAAARALGDDRYDLAEAENGSALLDDVASSSTELVLLDLQMPVMDGLTALRHLQALPAPPPVIVITADTSVKTAIEAVRCGAEDYIVKPYEIDELRLTVERVLDAARLRRECRSLGERLSRAAGPFSLLGDSPVMRDVMTMIERVAPRSVSVLITGETGTGKELAARTVHELSAVSEGPFVAVNCAAIPENLVESELFGHRKGAFTGADRDRAGRFREAHGGTLFLDEIGDMPLGVQAKLLRVLADGVVEPIGGDGGVSVEVRVLAATHQDLKANVASGSFREDLFYRLNVVEIPMPPLRERGQDILELAAAFLAKTEGPPVALSTEAERALLSHAWPGNVRELRNAMERAAIFCDEGRVMPADLPADLRDASSAGPASVGATDLFLPGEDFQTAKKRLVERFERDILEQALRESEGNVSHAAKALGLHRQNLQQKLRALDIIPGEFKGE